MADNIETITVKQRLPADSKGVKVYAPKIYILLRKNVGRKTVGSDLAVAQRYQDVAPTGNSGVFDLTKYLGEFGSVVTSRSVREAAGMFSISLADKMEPAQLETLYGLIEPMDVIEIRMARKPSDYDAALPSNPEKLPIVMRGLVSRVKRQRVMTTQGPQRSVVISGQDYGKILQIMRITYLPGMVLGQNILTDFSLFLNYGVSADFKSASDFIASLVKGVITQFIDGMRESSGAGDKSPVSYIGLDSTVVEGTVAPFGAQTFQGGTVYDLMATYGDVGPWNELYMEDRDDGPYLVYRPTPFKNLKGDYIQSEAIAQTIVISDADVIADEEERSDDNVANYFWVDAPRYTLIDSPILQAAEASTGNATPSWFLANYPNASPKFYGIRPLQTATQQGARLDGVDQATYDQGKAVGIGLVDKRRNILIENNRDNIVYESGMMRLRGNEKIKAGMYVKVWHGSGMGDERMVSERYAHKVSHEYTFGRGFITTIEFDRGTGFIERLQKDTGNGKSPYLGEITIRSSK